MKVPKADKSIPKALSISKSMELANSTRFNYIQSDGEIDKLKLRDYMIVITLLSTGVRVSELVNIRLKNIDMDDRTIFIKGKGNKERLVLFDEKCENLINESIDAWNLNDHIILNNRHNQLSVRYVQKIVKKYGKLCINRNITPHILRHSFATNLHRQGVDLNMIKKLLGHESLETTEIYTKIDMELIKKEYDSVNLS